MRDLRDAAAAATVEAPRRASLGDPRLSVVVTCHNYGHFLACCLESVLGQTAVPDEIVVVDDGSTDRTPDVLTRYADRVRAIHTPNRGQAAAFNAGFAASAGDLVLFLDADDMLCPEALEVALAHWADDLAVLAFGLETIDAAGRSLGLHSASLTADRGDNRPRLLRTGTFRFPPTSGNVFSRRLLEIALPMPEPRWRVSADCFLIRAAALHGRAEAVRQVLGRYRLHGGNNYARGRPGSEDPALHRANQRDVADALLDLAAADRLLGAEPETADAVRRALTDRATAIRAQVAGSTADRLRAGLRRVPTLWRGEATAGVMRSRWPVALVVGETYRFAEPGPHADAVERVETVTDRRARLDLDFRVGPSVAPLTVTLALGKVAEDAPGEIRVSLGEEVVASGRLAGRAVEVGLPGDPWSARRRVRLSVEALSEDGPAALPVIETLTLSVAGGAAPALPVGRTRTAASLWAAEPPGGWVVEPDGALRLSGEAGVLRFSVPGPGAWRLFLWLGEAPDGWLRLRRDGTTVFTGQTGGAPEIAVPLGRCSGEVELAVHFAPAGPEPLRVRSAGLLEAAGGRLHLPAPSPVLNPGERVVFREIERAAAFLGAGWATEDGACNVAPEAEVAFALPDGIGEAVLSLEVAPLLAPGADMRHVLGVSRDGAFLAVAQLDGSGAVEVPLAAGIRGAVRLVLHSGYVRADATGDEPATAPFELTALRLAAAGRPARPSLPAAEEPPPPRVHVVLEEAARLLDAPVPDIDALDTLRRELDEILAGCDRALCVTLAASGRSLDTLDRLGSAMPAAPQPHHADATDGDRLRAILRAMIAGPAFDAPLPADLADLPAPLFCDPGGLAGWLGRAPMMADAAMQAQYAAYLERLLGGLHRALTREPEGSATHELARRTLMRLRSTPVIFGDGCLRDVIRLRSRCIEALLVRQGARLAMPRPPRPARERLRVGVLARDVLANPEGWALLGMYAGLDRERFELVLIRMEESEAALPTGDRFAGTLCLAGRSVAESVAAVRGLDLDLLVTGCYFGDWEKTSAVAAHRLAPVQVWHGAVCPTTGGFRSFDVALSCRATEPPEPQRHYTETLAWIDGPRQCAYAFGPPEPAEPGEVRRSLGVGEGSVLLVSAAMAHKLRDELLASWAGILRAVPEAALVLCPFAPNWSMAFDVARFHRRLQAAGLPTDRVVVCPAQPQEWVRRIVAAADLYLDSHPYTGATTVCEALSVGTPVVTCAGDALRQLTGASWVRAYGQPDLVAADPEDYARIVRDLAADREALAARRAALRRVRDAGPPPHHDPDAFGAAFGAALWRVAQDSGLFPDLGSPPPQPVPPAVPRLSARTPPPVRLAILASPRTGSTLLCAVLNETPGVLCHFELFHAEMIQYRNRTVREPEAIADRDADPVGFLGEVFDAAAAEGRSLVAFKHFGHLSPKVTEAVVADPEVRLVHLGRANLLGEYSSLVIAKASGEWVSHAGPPQAQRKAAFDRDGFERFERFRRGVEQARLEMLAAHGRDALFLDYTTLRHPATAARLSRHLGLRIAPVETPEIRRQNLPVILDRFSNPDVVLDYLAERRLSHWAERG